MTPYLSSKMLTGYNTVENVCISKTGKFAKGESFFSKQLHNIRPLIEKEKTFFSIVCG